MVHSWGTSSSYISNSYNYGYENAPRKLPVVQKKNLPPCSHSRLNSYTEPCFRCDKYCNCDLNNSWPDVIVRSLDRQTVRLSSVVVRGSCEIQIRIKEHRVREEKKRRQKEKEVFVEGDSGFHDFEIIDLTNEDSGEVIDLTEEKFSNIGGRINPPEEIIDLTADDSEDEEETGLLDLIDLQNDVIDLRSENDIPTFGITAKILNLIQKYMELHLDQVDLAVEAERRAAKFFASSLFPRPPIKPSNHFAYEKWEEDFFDIDMVTFFSILQAKFELIIWDLHFAVEKWILLFRGRPAMDDFGEGNYLLEPKNEKDDSGCQDFYLKKVLNVRRKSNHAKPVVYWTRHYGFTFPRSFQWKRR